jgi:UDP-2,4-diacetamido-2,4,6-trideoxy-beta-L-altropyranose hydrolase
MRCLVLADELGRNGYDIEFACSPLKGDMRMFIREHGFSVITLPQPQSTIEPLHGADYVAWLQKSVAEDARDFLTAVTSANLVITDHYAIGYEWQECVIASLDCWLFAIDDLGRSHKADLILDQTFGRNVEDYGAAKARTLLGSGYALLRPDFASRREEAFFREPPGNVPKVLVSMGGVDAPNATFAVLESLCAEINAEFTVLLSPSAPHFKQVKEWCSLQSNFRHQEFVSDMAS